MIITHKINLIQFFLACIVGSLFAIFELVEWTFEYPNLANIPMLCPTITYWQEKGVSVICLLFGGRDCLRNLLND